MFGKHDGVTFLKRCDVEARGSSSRGRRVGQFLTEEETVLDYFLTRFRSMSAAARFYVLGSFLFLAIIWWPGGPYRAVLVGVSSLFAVGFAIWSWPWVKRFWSHPFGKVMLTVWHLGVLFAVHVICQDRVAAALGLPAEDFDNTVYALSFLLYFPVWAASVTVLAGVIGVILFLGGFVVGLFKKPEDSLMLWGHGLGAAVVVSILGSAYSEPVDWMKASPGLVRGIAYTVDYRQLKMFPGVPSGHYAKVHANGWVSLAIAKEGSVVIQVVSVESGKPALPDPGAP